VYAVGGDCEGSGVRVGDFKTGWIKGPKVHLQVGGAYPLLWVESGRTEPVCGAELVGLNVNRDAKYVVAPARGTPATFEQAVAFYRTVALLQG
jgi:hypothetical protein